MNRRDQILHKLHLTRTEIPGEIAEGFDRVLKSRVGALYKYHFIEYTPTIHRMEDAVKAFARDIYLQGIMDGMQVSKMNPDFLKSLETS